MRREKTIWSRSTRAMDCITVLRTCFVFMFFRVDGCLVICVCPFARLEDMRDGCVVSMHGYYSLVGSLGIGLCGNDFDDFFFSC